VLDYPTGALIVWVMAVMAMAGAWSLPRLLRQPSNQAVSALFQREG